MPGLPAPVAVCTRRRRVRGCGRAVGRGRNSRIRPGAGIRVGPAAIPGRAQRLPGCATTGCLPNRHDATAAWTAGSRGLRNSGGEMPWMWTAREHRQDFSRCPHCAPRCARQDSTMGAEIDVLQACARAILLLPTGSASQVTGAGCRVRRRVATRSTPSPSRRPAGFSAASSGPFRGSYR